MDREQKRGDETVEMMCSNTDDGGWIPCEERLPETRGTDMDYLVTIKGVSRATTLNYDFSGNTWFDDVGNVYPVIAWQPLPDAYRPKQKTIGEDYKQRTMERFMKVE